MNDILLSAEIAGPVPEDRVIAAEEALGIRFPTAYRAFLLRYGAVLGNGWEINGIDPSRTSSASTPLFTDIVAETLLFRRGQPDPASCRHVPIAHDGMELTYLLDLATSLNGDCPVVEFGPGVDFVQVSPTFSDFVLAWASGSLHDLP